MIATDCGIPIFSANSLFTATASAFNDSRRLSRFLSLPFVKRLSIIPVSETPSSLSSEQFFFHAADTYLKFVSVD